MTIFVRYATCLAVAVTLMLPQQRCEAEEAADDGAAPALEQARAALQSRQTRRAKELLDAFLAESPGNLDALQLLGVTEETLGNQVAALSAYGRALAVAPADDYSTKAVRSLCREGLPLKLPAAQRDALFSVLGAGPLEVRELSLDTSAIQSTVAAPVDRRAFHTTGVLYAPKSMMRDPSHSEVAVEALPDTRKFNRVSYGYVLAEEGVWRLRFRVHYVSGYLIGVSHAELAERMCDLFLRLYWLGKDALAVETRFAKDGVVDVWLVTEGEAGGEHRPLYNEHLFFSGIDDERPGIEWVREVAHEYGHHVIPPIDGYSGVVESWATGIIGERLFLPWLRTTGYGIDDDKGTFPVTEDDYLAYRRKNVSPDADFFLDRGPSESLGADRYQSGWRYLHGLLSYIVGQYGSEALAATFKRSRELAPGEFMTGIDLLKAFQDTRNERRELTALAPSLPIPSLSTAPAEAGATVPRLAQGASLAWWVYLPTADWEVTVVPSEPRAATLGVGLGKQGGFDRSLILSADAEEEQWLPLGTLATGWHVLKLQGTNVPEELALKAVRLRPATD